MIVKKLKINLTFRMQNKSGLYYSINKSDCFVLISGDEGDWEIIN